MPETTNLKLPTFDPNDKPSWLGSWNGAMNTIDQTVGRIDGDIAETDASIEAAQTAADAAKTTADAAQAAATDLQGQVNQNKTDIQSQAAMIETLQDNVQNIVPPSSIIIGKIISLYAINASYSSAKVTLRFSGTASGSIVWYNGRAGVFGYNASPYTGYFPWASGRSEYIPFAYCPGNPLELTSGEQLTQYSRYNRIASVPYIGNDSKNTFCNIIAVHDTTRNITIFMIGGPNGYNIPNIQHFYGCAMVSGQGNFTAYGVSHEWAGTPISNGLVKNITVTA